jgi:hypothetical protein
VRFLKLGCPTALIVAAACDKTKMEEDREEGSV